MLELKTQFQFVTGDFQSLLRLPKGLVCLHIDDLPSDFPRRADSLETMVFFGEDLGDQRVIQLLDQGCADFILSPRGSVGQVAFIGAKLRSIAFRLRDQLAQKELEALEGRHGLHLTEKERRLLRGLLLGEQGGMTRAELVKACWPKTAVNQKTLDTHLFNLRRKLEAADYQVHFQTGRWYLVIPSAQNESKIS